MHPLCRFGYVRLVIAAVLLVCWGPGSRQAFAQNELEDLLGGLGTAESVEEGDAGPGDSGAGRVAGQVFDRDTGAPVVGVTVIIEWPPPRDGSPARQELETTDVDGAFEFNSIPSGSYRVSFIKAGYRASAMTDFAVVAGEENRADFPLPPIPADAGEQVMELEAFVVEASTVNELMSAIELRLESDQLVNVLSAEDLSRFAASDVADALKRVAGVNIVEGQFAIIRGLEDRYSSTLYNGAIVPSPDPDRQSVQLDLFPSEVVSNLVVSKSFSAELPSNSAGGSIDIQTHDYPEAPLEIKLRGGAGFNEKALDEFLSYQSTNPVGEEDDGLDLLENEFGLSAGGRFTAWGEREVRYKFVGNRETDVETAQGYQEGRAPFPSETRIVFPNEIVLQSGGLALGELALSDGEFDFTQSERTVQDTLYGGLGLNLDRDGRHRLDGSLFFTRKEEEIVQLRDKGYFPGFDYAQGQLDFEGADGRCISFEGGREVEGFCESAATPFSFIANTVSSDGPDRAITAGSLLLTSFARSQSFKRNRDLLIAQLNGAHEFAQIEGLRFDWAGNYATTTQDEESRSANFFFEPNDPRTPVTDPDILAGERPIRPSDLGGGFWVTSGNPLLSTVDIDEDQWFARGDLSYERQVHSDVLLTVRTGGWFERAERGVDANFLISPSVRAGAPNSSSVSAFNFVFFGDTLDEVGGAIFPGLQRQGTPDPATGGLIPDTGDLSLTRVQKNDALRKIWAWNVELKATLWDRVDLVAGLRIEDIKIQSDNDPFVRDPFGRIFDDNGNPTNPRVGAPLTFPDVYILFDRLDNPSRGEGSAPPGTVFNDQLLNLDVPVDLSTTACEPRPPEAEPRGCVDLITVDQIESTINGKIDERLFLPTASLAYRPLDGLTLRAAFSRTYARPSFRELGFYVSLDPGSDDQTVGNPQLGLSKVTSYDGRVEYTWGESGDLFAASVFYKEIKDPIESFVVRNQFDFESGGGALFRTFFNNPSKADLLGVEVEFRKTLDFIPSQRFAGLELLHYFSLGGNFTYIDAEVKRTPEERARATTFFLATDEDRISGAADYSSLESSRRLFGQPEWIANADIAFDHPDWGTKATIALFGISDVLDAAGTAFLLPRGNPLTFTPDRYVDSFFQLDFVFRQELWAGLSLSASIKNLTDSKRRIVYDRDQTNAKTAERSVRVGRDYSFSLTYEYTF